MPGKTAIGLEMGRTERGGGGDATALGRSGCGGYGAVVYVVMVSSSFRIQVLSQ